MPVECKDWGDRELASPAYIITTRLTNVFRGSVPQLYLRPGFGQLPAGGVAMKLWVVASCLSKLMMNKAECSDVWQLWRQGYIG